jgi:hypothetical protein
LRGRAGRDGRPPQADSTAQPGEDLPGSGGSAPTLGIPAYVTAPPRLLDTLDPYGGQSGAVVKPVSPSPRTPAQEVLTTERSPLQQAALDGLRNTAIAGTGLGLLTLLYQLGYLAVGGVMHLPGSRPLGARHPDTGLTRLVPQGSGHQTARLATVDATGRTGR